MAVSRPRSSATPRPPRPRSRASVVGALGATAVLAGCGSGAADGTAAPDSRAPVVEVVATTTQLADIVREVGGDAVDVHQILQPGSDPHEYEPRPGDVTATARAKVVFSSGLGLDEWSEDVRKQSGSEAPLIELGEGVPTKLAGDEEHGAEGAAHGEEHGIGGGFDPHWWHDPTNVEHAVGAIRDAIVEADPRASGAVTRTAAAYLAKVRALDAGIQGCISAIPRSERKLVTSHDAFRYFARRYGIAVVGAAIPSQTTQAQASAGQVAALSRIIRRERVKAIFPESSVNPKLSDAIAKETGASSDLSLYGDSLGDPRSDGATYLGMERHNADAVVRGLTGEARGCAPSR